VSCARENGVQMRKRGVGGGECEGEGGAFVRACARVYYSDEVMRGAIRRRVSCSRLFNEQ